MSSSTLTSKPGQRNQSAAIPTPTRSVTPVRAEGPAGSGSVSGPVAAHGSADADQRAKAPANKSAAQPQPQTAPSDKQPAAGSPPAPPANKQPGASDKQTPGNQSPPSDRQPAESGKPPSANQPAPANNPPAASEKQPSTNQSALANRQPEKHSTPKPGTGREVVFELDDQNAHDIRLAGCFTNWDKSPIALRKINSKRWQTKVRLGPGRYHYRYLVDGEWRDDPRATTRDPNPYGTFDSVMDIS